MSFATDLARLTQLMTPVSSKAASFRGMLYGPSGAGKSTLGAMVMRTICPPDRGILYVDTSEGYVSIRNIAGLADNIQCIPFTTIEDLRVIGQAIREKAGVFAYVSGIVLDEASSMAQLDLDRVFEARKARDPQKTTGSVPEWEDYNSALVRFRTMLAELTAVPGLNVLLIAHVKEKKDSRGVPTNSYPAFSPTTAAKIKEPLHLVGYLTAGVGPVNADGSPSYTRQVQVHPTLRVDAKTRIPVGTTTVPADSLPVIIQEWLNSGGQEVPVDSTPRQDVVEPDEDLTGLDPEEIFEKVEETEPDTDADIFVPINID